MTTQINLQYQIDGNNILLNWNNIGTGVYYIYRRTDSPGEPTYVGTPYKKVSSNRFKETIPSCSAYSYMISTPDQITSNTVTVVNLSCTNILPITLAGDFSNGQINLNWNSPPNIKSPSYYVLHLSSPQNTTGILDYTTENNTSISFLSKTTGNNIYRIVVYSNNTIVAISNPVTIATTNVTNFQILNINPTTTGISMNWTQIQTDNYQILRNGQVIANTTKPTYTDANIQIGNSYTYQIIAGNQSTNEVTIVVPNSNNNNIPVSPLKPNTGTPPSIPTLTEDSNFLSYGIITFLILLVIILAVILFASTRRID